MGNKRYARKAGERHPREAIAIFTEGKVSEVEYLQYLMNQLGIPKELVQLHGSVHSDPKGLVDDAVLEKRRNERDSKKRGGGRIESWWVLADTECGRPGLNEAIQKAIDNGIWLGLSDPSVEFWFLLHFQYTTRSFGDVRELIRQLREYLPDYDAKHKHPDMRILFPLLCDAMSNAAKLRDNHNRFGNDSPRTDFDLLVQDLNYQAGHGRQFMPRKKPEWGDLSLSYL